MVIFGKSAVCPLCNAQFILSEIYDKGDKVTCDNCKKKLEIVSVDPPVFKNGKPSSPENNPDRN